MKELTNGMINMDGVSVQLDKSIDADWVSQINYGSMAEGSGKHVLGYLQGLHFM